MKVIKFYSNELFYLVSGKTELEAKETLFDLVGEMKIDKSEEIPESEWDNKTIDISEDNNIENGESFKVSIREMIGKYSEIICTNDTTLID